MALAGDAQEASERIGDVLRAGVDSVHVFPLGPDRMATVRAFADMMNATTKEREEAAPRRRPERPVLRAANHMTRPAASRRSHADVPSMFGELSQRRTMTDA